jgi:alkylresorcinol/alkylpyrone synthase
MPSIISIATALPEFTYNTSDVIGVGAKWLEKHPEQRALFNKFVTSSKTQRRNFILSPSDILSIGGMQHRAELFETFAVPLGTQALRNAFEEVDVDPRHLKTLIFTSCTCPSIPSVDALILEQLSCERTTNRIPIYQHGCAGGVVGLGLAAELSKVQGLISVTSVELCSLVFQRNNPTAAQLVGSAIFADGAASVLISPEDRGLVIRATQSYLVPDSRHLMGYEIRDDGAHLLLDRHLPQALIAVAPEQIRRFLAKSGLQKEDISYWLFHPGGTKILDFLEASLELEAHQAPWAREILTTVGNLSSATVLFVMKKFLSAKVCKPGDKVVMVGVGPGLTLELILFEWVV